MAAAERAERWSHADPSPPPPPRDDQRRERLTVAAAKRLPPRLGNDTALSAWPRRIGVGGGGAEPAPSESSGLGGGLIPAPECPAPLTTTTAAAWWPAAAFRPVAAADAECDVVPARLTPDGVSDAERHRRADETIGDHECQRRRLEISTQDAARYVRGGATTGTRLHLTR